MKKISNIQPLNSLCKKTTLFFVNGVSSFFKEEALATEIKELKFKKYLVLKSFIEYFIEAWPIIEDRISANEIVLSDREWKRGFVTPGMNDRGTIVDIKIQNNKLSGSIYLLQRSIIPKHDIAVTGCYKIVHEEDGIKAIVKNCSSNGPLE